MSQCEGDFPGSAYRYRRRETGVQMYLNVLEKTQVPRCRVMHVCYVRLSFSVCQVGATALLSSPVFLHSQAFHPPLNH